jgi:adenine-specific DNA-methyltransferase
MNMVKLSEQEIERIVSLLKEGKPLPEDYKAVLFDTKKEYELIYADKDREEDILADTMAVPLQPVKTFRNSTPLLNSPIAKGGTEGEWMNMLIFGDNLQVLKTLLQMKQEGKLKNADGTPGVRLVYIDPPFGTGDEYEATDSVKAYSAKLMSSRFIEFLRKRLIFLRELLSDDGSIFVRIDYHFGHYIKAIMDEVFGVHNFQNDIVINRVKKGLQGITRFNVSKESIYLYSKMASFRFYNPKVPRRCNFCGREKEPIWDDLTSPGLRHPPEGSYLERDICHGEGGILHIRKTRSRHSKRPKGCALIRKFHTMILMARR